MINDETLAQLIEEEEDDGKDERTEIAEKRETLLRYYNQRPYGDEVGGLSQVVTSEVSDVIESILPSLMRVYAQGKQIAKFSCTDPAGDEEAEQKTLYANHVFLEQNDGLLILHGMFKDALLQFSGSAKVYWDDAKQVKEERYKGLTREELKVLQASDDVDVVDAKLEEEGATVVIRRTVDKGQVRVVNCPPDQMRICKDATTWNSPRFMGQSIPKTRSQLVQMGFDKAVIYSLPAHDKESSQVENERNYDLNRSDDNPTTHSANDIIMLGEYYYYVDIDGDGIAELWQVFYAGSRVLKKQRIDDDPFATCVPVPMPHRAIGTCPAEQVADIQRVQSELVRSVLNNAYLVNHPRTVANERVDLDDLLSPDPGGVIRIEGDAPIGDAASPFIVNSQINELLGAIEYVNTMRENRTGITRFNQGLDADTLNQTATGFKGLMGASQQREQLIAMMLSVGVKDLFNKIIAVAQKHHREPVQVRTNTEVVTIDPSLWRYDMNCSVQVGIGSGDRQEKIANLNYILQQQQMLKETGSLLTDEAKIYNTLDSLVEEVGLRDVDLYFNDPDQPAEILQAQNEQLMQMVEQLQAAVENPLAEAERIRAESQLIQKQGELALKQEQQRIDAYNKARELEYKYTELETKEKVDIPGVGIEQTRGNQTG